MHQLEAEATPTAHTHRQRPERQGRGANIGEKVREHKGRPRLEQLHERSCDNVSGLKSVN